LTIEHRLRVFENKVLRRIFGCKSDKVTGGWRKLHNEELSVLFTENNQNDQIKNDDIGRHVAHVGEMRNVYKFCL
jgi:hypothetical protein